MLPDVLHDKAVQYVSGEMTAEEREAFEVLLEFQVGLHREVEDLRELLATVEGMKQPAAVAVPVDLKARILRALAPQPAERSAEALVATDGEGRIAWVDENFTALCGYSLAELKGRKPGELLQGPETDGATVSRIRAALRERRPCRETIVNYHKDGTRYRAEVRIAPILDEDRRPLWFVARERKVE